MKDLSTNSRARISRRYIAVCDVLGFRDLLTKNGLEWLQNRYSELEAEIRSLYKWEVKAQIFSDTVLLYSEDLNPFLNRAEDDLVRHALLESRTTAFLGFTGALITTGLSIGLPMRVGVSFGDCVIDSRHQIFLGQPIVDAYLTEKSQDWIGVALHDATFSWCEGQLDDGAFWRLMRWNVPLKQNPAIGELKWTINWSNIGFGRERLRETLALAVEANVGTIHEDRWRYTLAFYDAAAARRPEEGGRWDRTTS